MNNGTKSVLKTDGDLNDFNFKEIEMFLMSSWFWNGSSYLNTSLLSVEWQAKYLNSGTHTQKLPWFYTGKIAKSADSTSQIETK